jgi:hypothetical protein
MGRVPAAVAPDRLLQAQARYWKTLREARDDLRVFIELCVRNEDGQPVRLDQIHRSWIWHVNYCWSRGLHAQIMAPFGSGKTAFVLGLAAWLIGGDQQIRIKFVCAGDDNAKLRVGAVKELLETEQYRHVFPAVLPGKKWDTHEAFVRREGNAVDPTLHARGVMTRGIGGRADVEIFDDVADQLNSEDQMMRAKVKRFVHQTWLSRLDQAAGRALAIATPWSIDDVSHDLMHHPQWCTLVQSVSADLERYDQVVYGAGKDYLTEMIAG